MTTTNEAAERLLLSSVRPDDTTASIVERVNLMDAVRVEERRLTVEEIRERLMAGPVRGSGFADTAMPMRPAHIKAIHAILDEVES